MELSTIKNLITHDYNPFTSPVKNGSILVLKIMRVAQRFLYSLVNAVFSTNLEVEKWDVVDNKSPIRSFFLCLPGGGVFGVYLFERFSKNVGGDKAVQIEKLQDFFSVVTEKTLKMHTELFLQLLPKDQEGWPGADTFVEQILQLKPSLRYQERGIFLNRLEVILSEEDENRPLSRNQLYYREVLLLLFQEYFKNHKEEAQSFVNTLSPRMKELVLSNAPLSLLSSAQKVEDMKENPSLEYEDVDPSIFLKGFNAYKEAKELAKQDWRNTNSFYSFSFPALYFIEKEAYKEQPEADQIAWVRGCLTAECKNNEEENGEYNHYLRSATRFISETQFSESMQQKIKETPLSDSRKIDIIINFPRLLPVFSFTKGDINSLLKETRNTLLLRSGYAIENLDLKDEFIRSFVIQNLDKCHSNSFFHLSRAQVLELFLLADNKGKKTIVDCQSAIQKLDLKNKGVIDYFIELIKKDISYLTGLTLPQTFIEAIFKDQNISRDSKLWIISNRLVKCDFQNLEGIPSCISFLQSLTSKDVSSDINAEFLGAFEQAFEKATENQQLQLLEIDAVKELSFLRELDPENFPKNVQESLIQIQADQNSW